MELTFLGGASEVGASSTLLSVAGHRILIDGGMRPAAREGESRLPRLALLEAAPPEAILLTHAHIDHTGAMPLIASLYPGIPIYATESTRVVTEILLRDSVRIMEQEQLKPDGETPLYTAEQVDTFLARITAVHFQQAFAPIASAPEITVRFLPAGHILGAAMLFLDTPEGSILHTGDISVTDQRTIKGLDVQSLPQADLMICEGTYGNRSHGNRKEEERRLTETVQATLARGGRILCPAFAVGRSQEIVLILKAYRASGQVSPAPIHLDGMVRSVCTAYQMQSHDLHPNLQRYLVNARRPLFADPGLAIFAVRSQERRDLAQRREPMLVIASSGMLSGGASPIYAAEFAQREQDCILYSGYLDEESPGAAMVQARQGDRLRLGDQMVTLNCQIMKYNLSGHADAQQMVHVVTKVNPRHLILVHGAPDALRALKERFPKKAVDIPTEGSILTLQLKALPHASSLSVTGRPSDENISVLAHQEASTSSPAVLASPTIEALWQVATRGGPTRPWTSVELGQHYYGRSYIPAQRPFVEQVLKEASPYFKIGRVGAQPTYLPRPQSETEQLRPLSELPAGEIVLVQGQQGEPQIGLLLSRAERGTVRLVADTWKEGSRPLNLLQLVPGIRREDWLNLPVAEIRQHLKEWREQVNAQWVDLIAFWEQCQGTSFSYTELCARLSSDEERLAYGIELLAHGHELFRREGSTWTPLVATQALKNEGLIHHLELVQAGTGTVVEVNEQRAILTGRSAWRYFEVYWQDGEDVGKVGRVRSGNIRRI